MRDEGGRQKAGPGTVLLFALLVPLLAYSGTYVWARATHELVRYSGGVIARPNAHSGLGFTWWEIVFFPAAAAEERVRRALHRP